MEDEVDKERQSKWKIKGEDVDEEECAECVALKEKVSDLKFELEAEHRDAEKTIRDVEKMEDQHKQEIEKLYRELDFEKDKVVALTSTLDHERKARMQEIYKIERQSLEHDHNMKDYNFINEKNQNLGQEFEAVKRENETLINITKQLQDNKISILEQMKIYETQITELERKNTDLRKRLYDSDNEKDRHKVQAARMKQKLHDYLNGIGDRTMPKKETKTSSLGPLKSFSKKSMQGSVFSRADEGSAYTAGVGGNTAAASNSYVSRHPYTGGGTGVDLETSNSMYSDTRLRSSQSASMLSSVNYIRKFNTDPRTVSNSKKKNPMLWPVPY